MTPQEAPARLVDVSSLPAVYIDGIAKIFIVGSIIRLTCFEYKQLGAERVKMPNLEIVHPLARCDELILLLRGCLEQSDETETRH